MSVLGSLFRGRGLPIWLPTLIFLVLLAAYGMYWRYVRAEAAVIIEDTVADWRQQGIETRWGDLSYGGFPFRISALFKEPVIVGNNPGSPIQVRSDELRLHTLPHDLYTLIIEPRGVIHTNDANGSVVTIDADRPIASMSFKPNGEEVAIETGKAEIQHENAVVLSMDSGALYLKQLDDDARSMLGSMRVEAPLWIGIDPAKAPNTGNVDLAISHWELLAVGIANSQVHDVWATAGGKITIRGAGLSWGDARAAVQGALSVAADGYLSGELDIVLTEPAVALARLADLGLIDRSSVGAVSMAATMAQDQDQRVRVPLRFANGEMRAFGIKLGAAPIVG